MRSRMKYKFILAVNRCFALLLLACGCFTIWLLLEIFCITSFHVPTGSMEPTLISGDVVWVNKLVYGARIFKLWDAADGKEFAIKRLPGFRQIERNDVVVFNYPYPIKKDKHIRFDLLSYYVKRCVALPGDTFIIKKGQYEVRGCNIPLGNVKSQKTLLGRLEYEESNHEGVGIAILAYPNDSLFAWTIKTFGPFYIPNAGALIPMNYMNMILYKQVIEWEQKKKLEFCHGKIFLDGRKITKYRFLKSYYFVVGDKTESSCDSRYWGLLPEEFIVGKASWIGMSKDMDTGKVRWDRVGAKIQ